VNDNEFYDYDDMEARAREVIEVLSRKNVAIEDIMQLSGKSHEEVLKIIEELGLIDKFK